MKTFSRYPNLWDCRFRSAKMLCSYDGIDEEMSVSDGTVNPLKRGYPILTTCSSYEVKIQEFISATRSRTSRENCTSL